MERLIWKLDQVAPLNFTTVARVKGPLTEAALVAGLAAVRARHPYLRARIAVDASGEPVLRTGEAALSLRVVAAEGDAWITEAEREVNEPLPAESGPLVRCVIVRQAPDDHHVMLTFHHSVGDGMSGVYLMRDLVKAAGVGAAAELAPLEDTRAMDDRLPARARWGAGWLRGARLVAREAWLTLREGKPVGVRRDREALPHARRARLIHEVLDEAPSRRLAERARAEGTTVHGALSAAMVLGLLGDAGARGRGRVAFGSAIDLRRELDPPVGEDLGLYVSTLAYGAAVHPADDLWDLARSIRADLATDLAGGMGTDVIGVVGWTFHVLGGHRLEPKALVERWRKTLPASTGLTNLGRLTIETRFGVDAQMDPQVLEAFSQPSAARASIAMARGPEGAGAASLVAMAATARRWAWASMPALIVV